MDVFYHVITFIGGLIGGVVLTIYKYRNYILPITSEIMKAYEDGKITFHEVLGSLIVAYSMWKGEDERKIALETIRYLKQRWNLD
jgi:hypothetical protein